MRKLVNVRHYRETITKEQQRVAWGELGSRRVFMQECWALSHYPAGMRIKYQPGANAAVRNYRPPGAPERNVKSSAATGGETWP